MSLISEHDLQELLSFLERTDSDGKTTGLFVYILTARQSGLVCESVLTRGELPDIAEHIAAHTLARLQGRKNARQDDTPHGEHTSAPQD